MLVVGLYGSLQCDGLFATSNEVRMSYDKGAHDVRVNSAREVY
jgi:hypothetical protein